MMDINGFTLGGVSSKEYGIIMTAPPVQVIPERDVEIISVAGRSGDLIKDNGRYKNVPLSYSCAILPLEGKTFRETVDAAIQALRVAAGYRRLEDTYNPNRFRFARISSTVSVSSIVEQAGEFTLTFDCKPQRFLLSGETAQTFTSSGKISNPTAEIALPLITVYGSGAGKVSVGGITVEILELSDRITLDCEAMNAYRQVDDAAAENKNSSIRAPEFPALQPGDNAVSWTGGISRVEIAPRWWTL